MGVFGHELKRSVLHIRVHGFSFTGRPKRIIQYSNNDDMHAYVASGKQLPGAMARTFHTRRNPPTLEVRPVPVGT
ncbi:hypothetical protein SCLCIDRAFT_1206895 [Scleroderma citrinum Foug A]|uniref:Uncharacterized protein n=1 Tax=Scleroderma citrinum Foug A TaxID=1036808 RepID=A0A0C3EDI8_9AGAM|nr:hypothetical protein SCLCIDRAFT_1206895 [Scleroderma citrinum Foug A]